jgi:hypothetical protein
MWRSDDKGETWILISDNTGYPGGNIRLTDIDVRLGYSGDVWIVFGGFSDGNKVFYSSNAGSSWTNMTSTLPNVPVNTIEVDNSNNAYIGTDIGVFYRGAGMSDWVPYWHQLPIIPVTDLELYEDDNVIRAATFGRGVWESPTYSTCSASLTLTSVLSGNRYYEVSDMISFNSAIFGGLNTHVIFKAGNEVLFTPGVIVGTGNTLHAYIAPCGTAQSED